MTFPPGRAFQELTVYFGDIHNHCDLSYGHGSLTDALYNARLQLDFASVTVHAVWPDLPTDDPQLAYLVDYHKKGFEKAQANWTHYLQTMEQQNNPGQFVTFPSFEWHSIKYGDYCIYYKQSQPHLPIIDAPSLPALREKLRAIDSPAFLIPHHIGYRQGSRGINWQAFTDEMSPVVEIFSFHGLSETSEGPYPYLHSMGPRHEHSTARYGWAQGNLFGVVGSTDHHNAFPGSYGYGRMGVWATSLNRDALWDAIHQRRTYALTGDNILLQFSVNEHPMGSLIPADSTRWINVNVAGNDAIDYVDVLHNNRIIHRENVLTQPVTDGYFKLYIEMGWGEQAEPFSWDVKIDIEDGRVHHIEPRLRGIGPTAQPHSDDFTRTSLDLNPQTHQVHCQTHTRSNTSLHTPATEGFVLEIEGHADTCICLNINGRQEQIRLETLMAGAQAFYTGGFVSPAICLHQAIPRRAYAHRFAFVHQQHTTERDWYYVRVRQRNNQWAWSSPVWVDGS